MQSRSIYGSPHFYYVSEDRKQASLGWPECCSVSPPSVEEETDRREGKGRRCCMGDVLECHTNHLAARMI